MFTGIGHVTYRVSDLDKALDFYCGKLGFEKKFVINNEKGELWIQYVKTADDQFIELYPVGEAKMYDKTNYKHTALHTDDIYAEVERLRALGVFIRVEPTEGLDGSIQAWISDPDGNPIELMQLTDKSMQRMK